MIKQVRVGMFETNSSSMHSISIAPECKEEMMDTIQPDGEGIIYLTGGTFGWEERKYTDALTKAEYLAVWVREYSTNKVKDRRLLDSVIKKQTGAKTIEWAFTTDYKKSGKNEPSYIDHQSDKVGASIFDYEMVWSKKEDSGYVTTAVKGKLTRKEVAERLRQFLFNPKSVLISDNDNHE
jgi:hypothetical protein